VGIKAIIKKPASLELADSSERLSENESSDCIEFPEATR
jgi:hypothetical protein